MTFKEKYKHLPSLPRIVCAAIKIQTNQSDLILIGARHWDSNMHRQFKQSLHTGFEVYKQTEVQGFIDQFRNFYGRKESLLIARENNQIRFELYHNQKELFSEMLY